MGRIYRLVSTIRFGKLKWQAVGSRAVDWIWFRRAFHPDFECGKSEHLGEMGRRILRPLAPLSAVFCTYAK